jgi:hypothetical protein
MGRIAKPANLINEAIRHLPESNQNRFLPFT